MLKIVCLLIGLILALLIGEGTLTGYSYLKKHTLSRANLILNREESQKKLVGPQKNSDKYVWDNNLVLHPLFGYVYNAKLPDVNNFGFKSKYDIVISDSGFSVANEDPDKIIVVGIFGGSFAEGFIDYDYYLESKLRKVCPDRLPIILNFGIGGHSMPQQAFIFIYFNDLLDIAVFIDGLNEIWNPVENNNSGFPPEYAKASHFKYKLSLNELSPERFILTSQVIEAKTTLAWLTKVSLSPIVRQSLLVHHIWLALEGYFDNRISMKSFEIEKSYEKGNKFYDTDDEHIIVHEARQWNYYHQLIHEISSSRNILDIHLLQPNPFVQNSKTLTSYERQSIKNPYHIRDYVLTGYPRLQSAMSDLKKSGILAEDLSYIFENFKGPVWRDAAHPNKFGYEIIMDKVYEMISKNRSTLPCLIN